MYSKFASDFFAAAHGLRLRALLVGRTPGRHNTLHLKICILNFKTNFDTTPVYHNLYKLKRDGGRFQAKPRNFQTSPRRTTVRNALGMASSFSSSCLSAQRQPPDGAQSAHETRQTCICHFTCVNSWRASSWRTAPSGQRPSEAACAITCSRVISPGTFGNSQRPASSPSSGRF